MTITTLIINRFSTLVQQSPVVGRCPLTFPHVWHNPTSRISLIHPSKRSSTNNLFLLAFEYQDTQENIFSHSKLAERYFFPHFSTGPRRERLWPFLANPWMGVTYCCIFIPKKFKIRLNKLKRLKYKQFPPLTNQVAANKSHISSSYNIFKWTLKQMKSMQYEQSSLFPKSSWCH